MPSEMVERCARAIEGLVDTRLAHMTGREMVEDGTIFPALARAGLEALREPTEGMTDAARDATGGYPYAPHGVPKLGYLQIGIIWRAMVDTALKDTSE